MKLSKEARAFEARLGHSFDDPALLLEALTHPSMSGEVRRSNQRMEFLGDRVLNLIIAEALLDDDPDAAEGVLAPRYNVLVRKETCAAIAREIDIGKVLRLGQGERKGSVRKREAALGDAFEAVIAAIYRDAGYETAKRAVLALYGARIAEVPEDAKDPKSALQEWAQGRGMDLPTYTVVAQEGPDDAPTFEVEVSLANGMNHRARGPSKRRVEKDAARGLLKQLED